MGKAQALRAGLTAANVLLKVALAPPCAACAAPLATPLAGCVCARCWAGIEPPPRVPWPEGPLATAVAGGNYAGALRDIIHAFKYDGRRTLAQPLGALMRDAGRDLLADADCIVPVPLHPWRRIRRGFNQAADLAATLGLPITAVLWRVRWTAPQAALTASQRHRNVRGAFTVSPLSSRRAGAALRGRVVILVDDVRTTGATLHACAEVLAAAGVREVRALTVAVRSDSRHDHGRQGS